MHSKAHECRIFEVVYPHLLYILKFLNDAKQGTSSQSKTSYFSSENNSVIVNSYINEASYLDPTTPQLRIGETTHQDCIRNIRDSRKASKDLLLPLGDKLNKNSTKTSSYLLVGLQKLAWIPMLDT